MNNLKINERRSGEVLILDIDGRITLGEEAAHLRKMLKEYAARGEKRVLLNMKGVSYIDSSGLGELVSGFTSMKTAGGELKLFNVSDRVHALMTITKLMTVFDVFDDEQPAVASFGSDSSAAQGLAG